jgi:hypothetical protein
LGEQLDRWPADPASLSLLGDYEANQVGHQSLGLDEQNADRFVVDRSQQRSGLVVSLGNRNGRRCDKLVLLWPKAQVAELSHVVSRDWPERNLHFAILCRQGIPLPSSGKRVPARALALQGDLALDLADVPRGGSQPGVFAASVGPAI